ncbi:response regulator transcription factor [Enterococcus sp. ALS3]|uniref:Response regulator transcription factor n=1 Tax=Enterococcus alishanensis TaxID=1303817 RepID=A0ABS6TGA7_9ENTE|nr:response regulator transcription factor [Enterococcus alishanensis]MBV7391930.1 response regulator transcription factor [Enterococcus alishanensis]
MKILLCEDQDQMRQLISRILLHQGYQVVEARDGEEALDYFYQTKFDLVIMDWMMPKISGLTAAKQMKQETTIKILMLTAKNLPNDEVEALVSGVDDYLAKPFHAEVLLARVAKLLGILGQTPNQKLVVVPDKQQVLFKDQEIKLSKKEYELLYYFYQNQALVLSREQILLAVWGMDNENDVRTVDSFVRILRYKFGKELIQTVYGRGYRFEIPEK